MTPGLHITTAPFFERTSKRRRGFPSETQVKRGFRIVHGEKYLLEKLGHNDQYPCGSTRRFKKLLRAVRVFWLQAPTAITFFRE